MTNGDDVIVVGARCAGSPTAMLLARKGHRVLVVDRATFPSDTISTHMVHPLGVDALARWGLLDRLVATGCPPIITYTYDFGPFTLRGAPGTKDAPVAYCPRRIVLDKLLVDAAAEAGAEIREGFAVEEILMEAGRVVGIRGRSRGGDAVVERTRVVVGADGRHSTVAASRDRALPMYDFTCQLATLEPPPPDRQQLFAAMVGNQQAMDGFAQMNAGTSSPAEFLSPESVRAILSAAEGERERASA